MHQAQHGQIVGGSDRQWCIDLSLSGASNQTAHHISRFTTDASACAIEASLRIVIVPVATFPDRREYIAERPVTGVGSANRCHRRSKGSAQPGVHTPRRAGRQAPSTVPPRPISVMPGSVRRMMHGRSCRLRTGIDSLFPCFQRVDHSDDTARCIERRRRHVYIIIF